MKKLKEYVLLATILFIAPAVAIAGLAKVGDTLYTLKDGRKTSLTLDFSDQEVQALEEYFGHIPDVENPPETSVFEDLRWQEAYVHVSASTYDMPVRFISLEHVSDGELYRFGEFPKPEWYAIVEIEGYLTNGEAESNLEVAMMAVEICRYEGMVLELQGRDVPTRINPLNLQAAMALVQSANAWNHSLYVVNNPPKFNYTKAAAAQLGPSIFDHKLEIMQLKMRRAITDIIGDNPAILISIRHTGSTLDEDSWYAVLYIDDWMIRGTDSDCLYAARIFDAICSIPGMTLEVQGDFVPSSKNPMTKAWTEYLIEEDGISHNGGEDDKDMDGYFFTSTTDL